MHFCYFSPQFVYTLATISLSHFSLSVFVCVCAESDFSREDDVIHTHRSLLNFALRKVSFRPEAPLNKQYFTSVYFPPNFYGKLTHARTRTRTRTRMYVRMHVHSYMRTVYEAGTCGGGSHFPSPCVAHFCTARRLVQSPVTYWEAYSWPSLRVPSTLTRAF